MKETRPLKGRELLAAGLVLLNVLVLTPCAWIAGHLWEETKRWRSDTEQQVRQLETGLNDVKADMALHYVTRAEFQSHKDRVNDRLINLQQ